MISECRDPSYMTDTVFQSTRPKLQYLDGVRKLLKELMGNFVQANFLHNCDTFTVDVHNTSFHVSLNNVVYIGIHATDTIPNSSVCKDKGVRKFKMTCKAFLIELVKQIRSKV